MRGARIRAIVALASKAVTAKVPEIFFAAIG